MVDSSPVARPIGSGCSATSVPRLALAGAGRLQLGEVVRRGQHGLGQQLLLHRRPDRRGRQVADDPSGQLDGERRRRGDRCRPSPAPPRRGPRGPRHGSPRRGPAPRPRSARGRSGPCRRPARDRPSGTGGPRRRCRGSPRGSPRASGSGRPRAATRMSHSSARWNDPPMVQPLHATSTGTSRSSTWRMPRWPSRHELVMGEVGPVDADRPDVAARREARALAPPDHRPDLGVGRDPTERGEQLAVHGVVERVVLLGVAVGEDGHPAVHLDLHGSCHSVPLLPDLWASDVWGPGHLGP